MSGQTGGGRVDGAGTASFAASSAPLTSRDSERHGHGEQARCAFQSAAAAAPPDADRPERQGPNPAAGETITIAASKKLSFTPAKGLRDALNQTLAKKAAKPA